VKPEAIAEKLGISRASVFRVLKGQRIPAGWLARPKMLISRTRHRARRPIPTPRPTCGG